MSADTEHHDEGDDVNDWHGFRRGNRSVHIGPIPGRKSIAFYTTDELNNSSAIAYFAGEHEARKALEALDRLIVPTEGGEETQ